MTAFVYAGAAIAAVAAVVTGFATPGDLIGPIIAATVLACVVAALSIARKRRIEQLLGQIRSAVPEVATGLVDAPPDAIAGLIAELRPLGFAMIAVTDTRIGGGQPIRTWVMTGEPWTTWVEVGMAAVPMAIFLSQAQTGRLLETTARGALPIDHPRLLVQALDTTPALALDAHRATLEDWTRSSGPPRVVRTLDDYLAVEAEQRKLTGGMRMAAFLEHVVEPSIRTWTLTAAIAIVTLLVVLVLAAVRA